MIHLTKNKINARLNGVQNSKKMLKNRNVKKRFSLFKKSSKDESIVDLESVKQSFMKKLIYLGVSTQYVAYNVMTNQAFAAGNYDGNDGQSGVSSIIALGSTAFFSLALIFGLGFYVMSLRYQRCPPNKILVVHGMNKLFGAGTSAKCVHGGGTFVWPVVQSYNYISLDPMQIEAPLKHALSMEMIRVNVPSVFTVAVGTNPALMEKASIRLLGLTKTEVASQARDIIYGQLRQVIASMKIEEINKDREAFVDRIKHNVVSELEKIGLQLINVNITDITDDSGYLESVGQKAAQNAIQQAEVDVAIERKRGQVGKAEQEKEMNIYVAQANAARITGENESSILIAKSNALLQLQEAETYEKAETRRREAEAYIKEAEAVAFAKSEIARAQLIEQERRADLEAPAKAEAAKMAVDAEAMAMQLRIKAQAEADATYLALEAQARGEYQILKQKALGLKMLVDSCGGSQQAFQLMLLEHIDELAKTSASAISNIKFDKVMVWDGQNGASTSGFIQNLMKTVPPALDLVGDIAGVDFKQYLSPQNNQFKNIDILVSELKQQQTKFKEVGDTDKAEKLEHLIKLLD